MPALKIDEEFIAKLIFRKFQNNNRFTQDSPVYPDVWMEYMGYLKTHKKLDQFRCDVILTPHRRSTSSELVGVLFKKLKAANKAISDGAWQLASTGESVAAKVTFKELITVILPLTDFWHGLEKDPTSFIWLQELVGALLMRNDNKIPATMKAENQGKMLQAYFNKSGYFEAMQTHESEPALLYSVSKNRPAEIAIDKSVPATKADASRRLFDIDGADITWAVLDTGIDARHDAFRKIDPQTNQPFTKALDTKAVRFSNNTRIVATYDFTQFRDVLVKASAQKDQKVSITSSDKNNQKLSAKEVNDLISNAGKDLRAGRLLDWSVIGPLLRIPHNEEEYKMPKHSHGSHVAGIIGAGCAEDSTVGKLLGMCPKINLYDIRVMNDQGVGDEFNIIAALQFVRWMNSQRDGIVIHGINLSLSLKHEVASFGCGQTPVCQACERLVAEGTVVVVAAGNLGQTIFESTDGLRAQGFRMVNITDPGNAETVITVGATHSNRPHSYGVSYFSSKGPTGDGRLKPDLVAPGEKINSTCIGNSTEVRDGTSMSAPHVSGAAALIMAKHRELIGKPMRIKQILCDSATDLGREKYFQGAGMVDVLRAIQSV